jgi:hypothetical protein
MIVVFFLLGALALLAALLLFGFTGCTLPTEGLGPDTDISDYPTVIKKTPDLVAYWPLGEPQPLDFPTTASDDLGGHSGDYFELVPVPTPDTIHHSPTTVGDLELGQPGLLDLSPGRTCVRFDGGYVQIAFAEALNPPQFSFEAWVSPDTDLAKGYYYCLVESAGPHGLGPKKTGWGLYLGPSSENALDGPYWQVWMGDGDQFSRVAIADGTDTGVSERTTLLTKTYLVVTFDGTVLQIWLYYPGTIQQVNDLTQIRGALSYPPFIFHPNESTNEGAGVFYIGAGSNLGFSPIEPPHLLYPFKGFVQEVALYRSSLVGPPPFCAGVTSILSIHLGAGGNF